MRFIYKIINLINSKVYIGQSYSEIERWRQHKYAARSRPRQYIDCAIRKYGEKNFLYEVILVSLTQEDGHLAEIELIKQYNSRDRKFGYNISPGGDEIWNKGLPKEKHPMYGKHHSKESKSKISASKLGSHWGSHSEETKKQMSSVKIGKVFTEDHKLNMSKSKIGKVGVKHSLETKNKISKGKSGKTKLTQDQINLIKVDTRPYKIIADEYGVHFKSIANYKKK